MKDWRNNKILILRYTSSYYYIWIIEQFSEISDLGLYVCHISSGAIAQVVNNSFKFLHDFF